jgi:Transglycosylase
MAVAYKVAVGFAALVLIVVSALSGSVFLYTRDLPDIEHLADFAPDSGNQVTDTCLSGLAFAVPYDRIGKPFRDALASAEPASSFPYEIARSLMCGRRKGTARTQLDVFRLSWHIRKRFSDEELFTIYANRAYFGLAATGIENASDHFFQKSADKLSVEEAALLAAVLRAPNVFSPFKHPDRAMQRRNEILRKMASQGKLSDSELTPALALQIVMHSLGNTEANPLPVGVLKALSVDEAEYCDEFEADFRKGCAETFRTNLMWREFPVTPQGYTAVLIENRNTGFCGLAGCALCLFVAATDGQFVQVFGTNCEVGSIDRIAVLKTATNGFYDIQKTWSDETTHEHFRWTGKKYSSKYSEGRD